MKWLRDLPLRRKLSLVIVLTCSAVLLLACGVLATYQILDSREDMVRDTTILANVLAKNTQAALAFDDAGAAQQTLLALHEEPSIVAARLYDEKGVRFADYIRDGAKVNLPEHPWDDGHHFESDRLTVFSPIMLNGKRIGTIYLHAGMEEMYDRLKLFIGMAFMVLAGSVLVALLLSALLQRPISKPILALAETARHVAQNKDFSVRAEAQGGNEIGQLTTSFNNLIASIEERDKALRGEITERRNAEERAQSQLSRLELLHRITRAIGERQDLKSIFQVAISSIEDQLPIDFGCVCLYDQLLKTLTVIGVGTRSVELAAEMGMMEQAHIPVDQNGLSRCVRGHLVYEPDVSKIAFPFPERLAKGGLRSLVVSPLQVESSIFGVLVAARRTASNFSSGECEFLRQLSEHVALAAHQSQLYGALQKAYNDLRQTQQAVMQQERLSALGQMASGIAHDINNALSPATLYLGMLLDTKEGFDQRTREYLETTQCAVEDVAATVARMREFYRQNEPQLTLTPVDLNRLGQQVVDLTRARWSDMPQQRGIVITMNTDFAPGLPQIMGAESEIREALINLVFNAVDSMPEGGVLTLRTRLTESAPSPVDSRIARLIHIEVADTGVGMDEQTRTRCLEPFYTTKGERGTGLGLAMVYGIVQRHGGEIEIDSALGKGTTMRIVLPVRSPVGAGVPVVAAAPTVPQRLRILIVDDDPLLLKSLGDILEREGHIAVIANGGQAGIDTFTASLQGRQSFSVVITDLGMPYVDGRKVASAIKLASPNTPVILLTGWGERLVAEGDIPLHVDRVLSKPPRLREIREALAQCVKPV